MSENTPACVRPLVVFMAGPDGEPVPAPYLLSYGDLAALFRLKDSGTRFPQATIRRYRELGLRSVRVGRKVWFRLDDVIDFLESHQGRLQGGTTHIG